MNDILLSAENGAAEHSHGGSLKDKFNLLLDDSAKAWNTSRSMIIFLWLLPILFCLAGVVAALMGKSAYKAFTTEDGIAENIQVVMFVVAFVFSFNVMQNTVRRGQYFFAALYGILCVGLFFIIGEEISWGQRLLGWDTPQHIKAINKQDETNIHNIYVVGETIKWLHLVFAAFGTFMPLLVMRLERLQRYRKQLAMLVPHYSMIPFFFIPLLWRLFRNLVPVPKRFYFVVSEYTEVIELVIASAIMLFLIFQYRQFSRKDSGAERTRNKKESFAQ